MSLVGDGGGDLVKLSLGEAGQFINPHIHEHQPTMQKPRIKMDPAPTLSPTIAGVLNWVSFSNTMPIVVMLDGGVNLYTSGGIARRSCAASR